MFSVSKVQASSSANDKVHSAEADIESNRVQLFKCMMVLKARDIEPSDEAHEILEKYFNEINRRSVVIREAIYKLIMENGNELGQTKVDDYKVKASRMESTVKGHEDSARRVYSCKVDPNVQSSYFSTTSTRSTLQLELLKSQIRILERQEMERLETLKETETKQAIAEANKNQQNCDVNEENDSEDITDQVFDEEDVEGIETMVYVINESLNVSDLVEDKSKNSSQVDTNKEVHNCVAKGFSSDKEKEFTKDVLVEKVYDEVQTKEKGSLSNCNDCAMM